MAPKTLLVFCDETAMGGVSDPPGFNAPSDLELSSQVVSNPGGKNSPQSLILPRPAAQGGISSTQYPTNVLRLARSVKTVDAKGNKQVVFYQSGIGPEVSLQGDPVTGTTHLQALGTAVASKIRDAYVFIAQNYEVGDEICLFGFSRGAYTARKLSELIDNIGLLTHKTLGLFFGIWRQLMNREAPTVPSDTRRVEIKCIGLWETVGSVYKDIDALNIVDTSLPATVKVALHALSLHENRKKFLPTLWTIPSCGLKPGQVLKQVWFAGAHSDVGGGYERHELADISLFWMAGEIESFINLDLELLRLYAQTHPAPWGISQPHNAYKDTSVAQRHIVGHETRLQSGLVTPQSVFHPSLMHSPASTQLPDPDYMVTMNIIAESFGTISYPSLNVFERHCKDRWGVRRSAPPGGIYDPWIVIRPQWASNVYVVDGSIPPSAVVGGRDAHGNLLYVARAPYYRGGIHPGKASPHSGNAFVSFGGKEIKVPFASNVVEVLVGPQASVRWAPVSGGFSLDQLNGAVPVPGGKEADKRVLYVVRAAIHNGIHCGKVELGGHAHIPWGGREEFATQYEVLVYA